MIHLDFVVVVVVVVVVVENSGYVSVVRKFVIFVLSRRLKIFFLS